MGTSGSETARTTVPSWAVLVAWLLGVMAMGVAMLLARPLGIRPALAFAEAALAAPGVLALVLFGVPLARGLALTSLTPRAQAFSMAAGGAFWAGSVGLLELQYSVWPPPPGYLEAFQQLHAALKPAGPFDALLSIAAIAVAPAVCEEILFRGVMLPAFVRRLGSGGAILASALLFGIIHLDRVTADAYTLYRVPFAVAVAVGFGVLRVRSGSLVPGLIAHAILNTITFLAVLSGVDTEAPAEANLLQGAGLLLAGVAASVALLRWFPRAPDAS